MKGSAAYSAKTILFAISIVFLGAMLWRLISTEKHPDQIVSYSDFLQLIAKHEIREARIYLEANSATVNASLSHPPTIVETTLSYGDLSDLNQRLIDSGASVGYANPKRGDWVLILLNAAPLILLVGFCFFLMRQGRGRALLAKSSHPTEVRTGIGYDLHRLAEGRQLVVGGIELPFEKGPVGHSDGDVLAHALCDALLGAAGLGDIGTHFPDTDPQWKGANSLLFLEHAKKLLDEKNLAIEHVDAVVITEKPKLGPHFPKMREALARALGVSPEKIHLKAKTNEGVDAIGRGEAVAAHVIATLVRR